MKKMLVIFGLCFIFLIGGAMFLGFKYLNQGNSDENIPEPDSSMNSRNLVYVVKEYNGNIAIFEENSDVPFKVTDIRLCELPEGDKKLLSKGIPASSSQELNCILEDYCS
jgi:hypothetical protein